MGFTRILSAKFRSKKAKEFLNDDDATTTANDSKTTSTTLLRSVSLGSGFMPSSGTITPPLTPIDDDDDVEELAVGVDTFNKKQKTASFLSSITAASSELSNRSVLLRISGKTTHDDRMPHDFGDESYPIGIPFEVESDLFVGKALLRVKGLVGDDPEGDKYFSGRCRTYQHVIQGRFKEEIPVSDFQSGYEFYQPLRRLPPKTLVKLCIALAKKLVPSVEISLHTDKPTTMLGTLAGFKTVRADKPGEEVDIASHNINEDCTLLGGAFAEGEVSARRRRKILSDPAKLKDYKFDTDTVYTIEFYEWIADLNNWTLPLGFTTIDLEQIFGRQPIHWVGKTGDCYLWSGGIIHKKLLSEGQPIEEEEEDDLLCVRTKR